MIVNVVGSQVNKEVCYGKKRRVYAYFRGKREKRKFLRYQEAAFVIGWNNKIAEKLFEIFSMQLELETIKNSNYLSFFEIFLKMELYFIFLKKI